MNWLQQSITAFFDGLTKLTLGASRLGDLSASGVWAFFTIILVVYIFIKLRQERLMGERAWEIRTKEIQADIGMSQAIVNGFDKLSGRINDGLDKASDELKEMRHALGQDKEVKKNV